MNLDEETITVSKVEEFRQAVARAKPGTRILLAPGEYSGGLYFANLRGEASRPIVIAAADPRNTPVIRGGGTGLHLIDSVYVELRDLTFTGASANGLNIDDGGSYDTPAHHIVLRRLKVTDVGSRGNHDGVKLSGVDDFQIEDCVIERWGTGSGSAIDMVGCHRGAITRNTLRHTDTTGSTGVQAKGGTSEIAIRGNRFENAGGRAVNIGGSTGLPYFRPQLVDGNEHYEAKAIRVEGNYFIGGGCAVAFVGVDGAVVRFNTIYRPNRWALRILQETREPGFIPSQNGEFTDNIVAFHSGEWSSGGINIGPGTAPDTFKFARNVWYCIDNPGRSKPSLPTTETGGGYGRDPQFRDADQGDLRLQPSSFARYAGAEAVPASESH